MAWPSGNRLLDALPPAVRERWAPLTRVVALTRAERTTVAGTVMESVDFPVDALMAVEGVLDDGTLYEVATVGTEAFVEIDAALEAEIALRSASCQFSGSVVRWGLSTFRRALQESPEFAVLVRRAVRARAFITEQNSICNLRHSVEERLARWLLVAHARLQRDDLHVTHELLADVLGVRRAGVSVAAAGLAAYGAISYARGIVRIVGTPELEEASCECYAVCETAIREALGTSDPGATAP